MFILARRAVPPTGRCEGGTSPVRTGMDPIRASGPLACAISRAGGAGYKPRRCAWSGSCCSSSSSAGAGPRAPHAGPLHGPGLAILDPWLRETPEGRAVVTLGFRDAAEYGCFQIVSAFRRDRRTFGHAPGAPVGAVRAPASAALVGPPAPGSARHCRWPGRARPSARAARRWPPQGRAPGLEAGLHRWPLHL